MAHTVVILASLHDLTIKKRMILVQGIKVLWFLQDLYQAGLGFRVWGMGVQELGHPQPKALNPPRA